MAEARVLLGNLHIQVPFVAGTRAPSVARRNVTLAIINVQGEGVEVSVSKVVPDHVYFFYFGRMSMYLLPRHD